jgi:hypothetical protein
MLTRWPPLNNNRGSATSVSTRANALAQGHVAARPLFEALLAEAEGVLHPQHVTIIDSLMPLVNCYRASGAPAHCPPQPFVSAVGVRNCVSAFQAI